MHECHDSCAVCNGFSVWHIDFNKAPATTRADALELRVRVSARDAVRTQFVRADTSFQFAVDARVLEGNIEQIDIFLEGKQVMAQPCKDSAVEATREQHRCFGCTRKRIGGCVFEGFSNVLSTQCQ